MPRSRLRQALCISVVLRHFDWCQANCSDEQDGESNQTNKFGHRSDFFYVARSAVLVTLFSLVEFSLFRAIIKSSFIVVFNFRLCYENESQIGGLLSGY